MATNVSLAAFSNFLPVMIKSFGYSALDTNLMTIPVWVCSGIFIVVTGMVSDRLQKRGIMLLISFAVASIGWIILLASKSQWVEFVGTLFIGNGTLPQAVLCQAWLNSNMIGYTKRYFCTVSLIRFYQKTTKLTSCRATTLSMILMLGQSNRFRLRHGPQFPKFPCKGIKAPPTSGGMCYSWLLVIVMNTESVLSLCSLGSI
jgi:MFS family permease